MHWVFNPAFLLTFLNFFFKFFISGFLCQAGSLLFNLQLLEEVGDAGFCIEPGFPLWFSGALFSFYFCRKEIEKKLQVVEINWFCNKLKSTSFHTFNTNRVFVKAGYHDDLS